MDIILTKWVKFSPHRKNIIKVVDINDICGDYFVSYINFTCDKPYLKTLFDFKFMSSIIHIRHFWNKIKLSFKI